jgi:hypothetical protein
VHFPHWSNAGCSLVQILEHQGIRDAKAFMYFLRGAEWLAMGCSPSSRGTRVDLDSIGEGDGEG